MYEEDILPNPRSESAFSGTNRDTRKANLPLEVESRACLIRATGKLRFDLWKPSLEKRSGVTFEQGRMYQILGLVKGVRFQSRHVANGGQHVYVFVDGGAGVAPGELCRLIVEVLEEKMRFAVVAGRHGPKVNLSEPALRGLGVPTGDSGVVELSVRSPGEDIARRVYARWDPLLGFMELQLGSTGSTVGDELEVEGGRRYDVRTFVKDFRAHKMRELANFELEVQGEALVATVDGKRVPVERHWLTTHGLKAAMKMEVGSGRRLVKLVFDGGSVEARFGNSDAILELGAVGGGVDVRYSRGAGQAYVMRLAQKTVQGPGEDLEWPEGGVKVVEKPEAPQGKYLLGMSEMVREVTKWKLNEVANRKAYAKVRGDIGEDITRLLLPEMGLELLYDHPWSELGVEYGSRREGPDFMVACKGSGVVAYIETKWYEDIVKGFSKAKNQVLDYLQSSLTPRDMKVTGAYIAILDWKLSKSAVLWVERVA
jgi:hypothetical protein